MRRLAKSLGIGIVVILFFGPAVFGMSGTGEPGEVFHPQVRETRGPVMIKGARYSIWEPAEPGMLLLSGDVLRTEKNGFAVIEFASGIVELYETTVLIIPSTGAQNRKKDIREVVVEEGSALFDINPLGVERGFEFRTKNVQGGVKGTMFTVSYLDGGTTVNVYRGEVQISDLQSSVETQVKLTAGKAVRVEKPRDFRNVENFDPGLALEDYNYNMPPGLTGKGLPGDSNANPDNKGVRDRGQGHGRDFVPGQNK